MSVHPQSSSSFLQIQDSNNNNKVKMVAGYALQQRLGSGSFAVVYKGVRLPQQTQPATSETIDTVAIKAITRTSEKLTKKVLANLEVEISILRTYRHRNIVCLHDVQKTERHFYLILEYCGGGDMQGLIRTRKAGRLSEGLTRRLMRDLASGLKFLWQQELIHRDIKPQNLLLTGALPLDELYDPEKSEELEEKRRLVNFPSSQFAMKIADFGFARHLQTTSLAETLCGSPLYMAPEILQHHRYDAKADLWSVGTVLFEMISGRPPFNGENHIDLLRNIQRKAVRLPPDVHVSKECVKLLRLLLNRNPLSRAGFKEFLEATDALVALGCQGIVTNDEGTCNRPMMDLGTIPENDGAVPNTESMLTTTIPENDGVGPNTESMLATTTVVAPPQIAKVPSQPQQNTIATPPVSTAPIAYTQPISTLKKHGAGGRTRTVQPSMLAPLVPSPPTSTTSPIYTASVTSQAQVLDARVSSVATNRHSLQQPMQEMLQPVRRNESTVSQHSSGENSFVMVEHSSYPKSPSASSAVVISSAIEKCWQQKDSRSRLEHTPPSSPGLYLNRSAVLTSRGEYMVVKQPKGMLSTSPGTGGALMGMISGRARLVGHEGQLNDSSKQFENAITAATKMLAAAEDVGRRAISVAHLGDNRAYVAMRLVMVSESTSSSLFSATPMEGIEEEAADHDSGAVTDDSSCCTEIISSTRRRRSSCSAVDKLMHDAKPEEEAEEMPFAVHAESSPVAAAGISARTNVPLSKGTGITSSRSTVKPTPAVISSHFGDSLSCYLKALKMLKGAVSAAQGVGKELETFTSQSLDANQLALVKKMQKRCEVTSNWLAGQFKGVLERADAANAEIVKLTSTLPDRQDIQPVTSVEELIYNHSLAAGREGAVKQLLGQFEAARSCYRSAGLLAETLLMESVVGSDDKKVLTDYVDGFAARILELDEVMRQQSQHHGRSSSSSATCSVYSSRRAPAVVGLVGQPFGKLPGKNPTSQPR